LFRYIKNWLLEFPSGTTFATAEPFLDGKFEKYLNNSMSEPYSNDASETALKAFALAHFSLQYGSGEFLLTDIQGKDFR